MADVIRQGRIGFAFDLIVETVRGYQLLCEAGDFGESAPGFDRGMDLLNKLVRKPQGIGDLLLTPKVERDGEIPDYSSLLVDR